MLALSLGKRPKRKSNSYFFYYIFLYFFIKPLVVLLLNVIRMLHYTYRLMSHSWVYCHVSTIEDGTILTQIWPVVDIMLNTKQGPLTLSNIHVNNQQH